jgi:hypothetical protein
MSCLVLLRIARDCRRTHDAPSTQLLNPGAAALARAVSLKANRNSKHAKGDDGLWRDHVCVCGKSVDLTSTIGSQLNPNFVRRVIKF